MVPVEISRLLETNSGLELHRLRGSAAPESASSPGKRRPGSGIGDAQK